MPQRTQTMNDCEEDEDEFNQLDGSMDSESRTKRGDGVDIIMEEDEEYQNNDDGGGESGGEEFERENNANFLDTCTVPNLIPTASEKKKKSKTSKSSPMKNAKDAPGGNGQSSKKEAKADKKMKGQLNMMITAAAAQNNGQAIMSPQIKITIKNTKQLSSKDITKQQSDKSQSQNTPNQSKGKAEKLLNSITMQSSVQKGTGGGDLNNQQSASKDQNSSAKMTKEQQILMQQAAAAALKEQKKKNKQKQVALLHSMPKNLEEEQQKFFESDCKVNPIFEYENPSLASKYLSQFKEPNDEFMQIAKQILDSFLQYYGSESNYLVTEGNILT